MDPWLPIAIVTAAIAATGVTLAARDLIALRRPAEPDPDDQAPTTDGTWTCPECDQAVPVTIVPERIIVMRLDPTDVEAHLLQHQEAGQ